MALISVPGEPLRLSAPLRRIMRLRGDALLTRLIRFGSYVDPPSGFIAEAHRAVMSALNQDPLILARDVLEVERAYGERTEIPVDARNTQFIAGDVTPGCYSSGYEPEITLLIDALVPNDGVFFDVGANWGYFSLMLAERAGFAGRIYAFEPGAGPRRDLERIVAACGRQTTILVRPEALSDRSGPAVLSTPEWSGMASIMECARGEPVTQARLDDLDLPAAALIKLDVEGAEGAVIAGASSYLDRHAPAIIFECRTDSPGGEWDRPFPLLREAGYETFALAISIDVSSDGGLTGHLLATSIQPEQRNAWPEHLNVLALKRQM